MTTKERQLFEACGMHKYLDLVDKNFWPISILYSRAGEFAFLNNLQGKPAESLRRVISAWNNCKPYRGTKEHDDLIDLTDSAHIEHGL